MREAFRSIDPKVDDDNFLDVFQASGCYLIDLAGNPVDRMDPQSRRTARRRGEKLLSEKIAQIRPRMIAPLLRAIADHVARAALLADWHGPMLDFPYPGRWSRHRAAFVEILAPVVRNLIDLADARRPRQQ